MGAFQFASARKVNATFKPRTVTFRGLVNGERPTARSVDGERLKKDEFVIDAFGQVYLIERVERRAAQPNMDRFTVVNGERARFHNFPAYMLDRASESAVRAAIEARA